MFQTCMTFFLLQNTKEALGPKAHWTPITFIVWTKRHTFVKISTFVSTEESNTCLEWREGEEMMTEFLFLGELSL